MSKVAMWQTDGEPPKLKQVWQDGSVSKVFLKEGKELVAQEFADFTFEIHGHFYEEDSEIFIFKVIH